MRKAKSRSRRAPVSHELATLRATARALVSGGGLDAVCRDFLLRAAGGLLAGAGAIFITTEEGQTAEVASTGLEDVLDPDSLTGLAALVARNGKPAFLRETSPTRLHRVRALEEGDRGAMAVPLYLDGRVVGVMMLFRPVGAPPFSDRDLTLASVLATELAQGIERLRMKEVLERRLSDTQKGQRQLEAYARDVRETYAAEKERAEQLAAAYEELKQTYFATVRGLAVAVEAKDEYTAGHIVRVTQYGLMLMRIVAPGLASDPQFEYGFLLHDIGKLAVPDAVLRKRGPLTEEEWQLMRLHSETGRRIIGDIPFLAGATEIVYAHHERWDGKGYPSGLKGEEIPLGARVFPVADSFDAMTSDRPYRNAMPMHEAIDELRRGRGTQFWPEAVDAFLSIPLEEIGAVRRTAKILKDDHDVP